MTTARRCMANASVLVILSMIASGKTAISATYTVPPDPLPDSIGAGSEVVLNDGGYVPNYYAIDGGTLTVNGGWGGRYTALRNASTLNLNGGQVSEIWGSTSSLVNMSGGRLSIGIGFRGKINMSGGNLDFNYFDSESTLTISGGNCFIPTNPYSGHTGNGTVHIKAIDATLNGMPIADLTPGGTREFSPFRGTLTCTLADGSIFGLGFQDSFRKVTVTLLPVPEPTTASLVTLLIPLIVVGRYSELVKHRFLPRIVFNS